MTHSERHPPVAARRTPHYVMWQHIQEQPAAITEALARNHPATIELARRLVRAPAVEIVGLGSSLHAAMLGEYWFRTIGRIRRVRAFNSFERLNYGGGAARGTVVAAISHHGWREFPARIALNDRLDAIAKVAICGADAHVRGADLNFITCAQEKSGAHTKSLITASAVLMDVALKTAAIRAGDSVALRYRREFVAIPARLARRIKDPSAEQSAAREFRRFRRIFLIGAGPAYTCAREGALKLMETAFVHAQALETEEFLHGPIASLDDATLVIFISAGGRGARRLAQAARASAEIGAARLAIATATDHALGAFVDRTITVEGRNEALSPFGIILSLQLFSYFSALARGCDPDRNHFEDSRFKRAAARYAP